MMSSISSVRLPRSDLLTPTASYSASFQPTPAPRMTRLSDEELERRQLLGQDDRVAQRHDQDRGAEPDPLGRAGRDRQGRQRLEPVDRVEPLADQQVVGDEQASRSRAPPPCGRTSLMPRARSGPSPSQMYDGRKTPNRPTSAMRDPSDCVCGLSGRDSPGRACRRTTLAPSSMSSVAKTRCRGVHLGGQARVDVGLDGQVDEALRLADRERAARGDLLADLGRARDGLAGRHDLVDEADALGLGGGEDPPVRISSLARAGPDDPRQALGPAGPGRDRQADLRAGRAWRAPTRSAGRSTGRAPGRRRGRCPRWPRWSASAARPAAGRRRDSSSCRSRPRGAALRLELADVRPGGEGPLAARRSRRPPGRRRASAASSVASAVVEARRAAPGSTRLSGGLASVSRATAPELELDRASLTRGSPKSAARPIGPVAYSRAIHRRAGRSATRGRKPIWPRTSRSTSMPGATSMSTRPSSSRAKTARSVM